MKPETAAFLAKSHECLAKADGRLAQWPDEAGRAAISRGCTQATEAMAAARSFVAAIVGLLPCTPTPPSQTPDPQP